MGSYGKRKENIGFVAKAIENARNTLVFCVGTNRKRKGKHVLREAYAKRTGNSGFALEPIENASKTIVLRGNL